jgi:FKBP-type peptidyl-prolyl cis-trans isomerase 2
MKRLISLFWILLFILPALLSLSAQEPLHDAPAGSIVINNGDWVTTITTVNLTLVAVDTESEIAGMQMRFTNAIDNWPIT